MWKTITKLVQLLGMFRAWTLRMDGSISVMLKFIYWIIFLSHFALYWCNTGVVSAIGVHFTVSAEGFRLQLVLGAVSRRNEHQESRNMAHPPWNFDISVFWNGIFNFCLCVMYYARRRSCYGSICSLNHRFKCLFLFFFSVCTEKIQRKNISVSYVCLKLQ